MLLGVNVIILSNNDIFIPVCFALGCKTVGDNCFGSPIKVTYLTPFNRAISVSGSWDWVLSSIITYSKVYPSNLSIIDEEHVVTTISAKFITPLHSSLKLSASKST